MKISISRSGSNLKIEISELPDVDVDNDEFVSTLERLVATVTRRHWEKTPHKHKARYAMSSCELCGKMEDLPPHTHST
jgi:hypothetical protein